VLDVVQNSPAAQSGIKKGDIVTAIDGVPTSRLDLFATREALKFPGKKVDSLTVKDKSHSRVVTFALRDLIPRSG
jgi:S1-C subfamily serine protease